MEGIILVSGTAIAGTRDPGTRDLNDLRFLKEIIADIKSKKELSSLDDSYVEKKLRAFFDDRSNYQQKEKILEKMYAVQSFFEFSKRKEYGLLLKSLRKDLRTVYGVFVDKNMRKRDTMLDAIEGDQFFDYEPLILMHQSTKERQPYYDEVYSLLFKALGELGFKKKKFVVLDLACGLNPLSVLLYRDQVKSYIASDISQEDCAFIERFFKKCSIDGTVLPLDLTEDKSYATLKKTSSDVCFLFKALDSIEEVRWNGSGALLDAIHAPFIVVSFPKISLGGKKFIHARRRSWFEKLLIEKKWSHIKKEIHNEVFYIIKK